MRTSLTVGIASFALAAALAIGGAALAATPATVQGTVGPGFTISLKKAGKKVTTLKAGRYTFVVADKSSSHDFHLTGPGVNKVVTSVDFTGTKRATVTLKKGTYRYVCDPHASSMKGSFRVT
jgi:plastocyanin